MDKFVEQAGGARLAEYQEFKRGVSIFPRAMIYPHEVNNQSFAYRTVQWVLPAVSRIDVYFSNKGISDFCTATMMNDRWLVTAGHCVKIKETYADRIRVVPNYHYRGARPLVFEPTNFEIFIEDGSDIAIIDLGTSSSSLTSISPSVRFPVSGESVVLVTHPLGQAKAVSNYNCVVDPDYQEGSPVFYHFCTTFSGSSGGALFSATDHTLLGFHSRKGADGRSIAYSSAAYGKIFETIGLQESSLPNEVYRNKFLIPDGEIRSNLLYSLRSNANGDFIKGFLESESENVSTDKDYFKAVVWTAIERGNSEALPLAFLARNKLADVDASRLVWRAVRAIRSDVGNKQRFKLLGMLLEAGFPLLPNSRGILPSCDRRTPPQVREFLSKYGFSKEC
ncbi:serine protease [Roseovarius sp. CAU 1744]|uniref:trypsin-like serine peptidase n=1 Tax=Roseovarius sp. CAU 1744 TaxID=3140368 RepID=UPI00325AFD4A